MERTHMLAAAAPAEAEAPTVCRHTDAQRANRVLGATILGGGNRIAAKPPIESTALADIVAEATTYATNIAPAQAAFDAADEAWVKSTDKVLDRVLEAKRAQLEQVWSDHVDRFLSIAEKILTLPATTPDALWRHVQAYAELLDPIVGDQDYGTALERLPKESLLTIIDHLINEHAGVVSQRTGQSGV